MSSSTIETAHKVLAESLGRLVLVKLRQGKTLRGKLKSFDMHLNIVLDDAGEEMEDGSWRRLGTVLIRGENVVMLSPIQ